jgi:hypothetical protein
MPTADSDMLVALRIGEPVTEEDIRSVCELVNAYASERAAAMRHSATLEEHLIIANNRHAEDHAYAAWAKAHISELEAELESERKRGRDGQD